jgi:CubicO group peptidase (beta-lactamase class C family)
VSRRAPAPGRAIAAAHLVVTSRSVLFPLLLALSSLALLALLAGPVRAAFPETPIGRRAALFVDVMRRGDADFARDFLAANYAEASLAQRPVESRLEAYRRLMDDMADPRVVEERYTETGADLIIESGRSGEMFAVRLDVEPDPPHKLLGARVQGGALPGRPVLPEGPIADDRKVQLLEGFLDRLAAEGRFSGSVLLAKGGTPLFQKAYGLANRPFDVPNRVDTKFCLGSMNKMFTAVAVAKLVEQGTLAWDDPVGKHLPEFPNVAVREKVTIHHLLTHTSGLGSYFNSPLYEAGWTGFRRVADYLPVVAAEELAFEPGAEMRYSNSGFIVAGLILEAVTGKDFYDVIRELVYAPAGMTDSDSYEMDDPVKNLAVGYTRYTDRHEPGGPVRANYLMHSIKGTPAGGGFSTAPDLLKFDRAMRSGRLLSASLKDAVTTQQVAMGPQGGYGYGMGVFSNGPTRQWGHNGGAPGMNAEFRAYENPDWTVIVLANADGGASPVADFMQELILQ